MKFLSYRGYKGTIEFSEIDNCFHGRVIHVKNIISYGGNNIDELKQTFEAAIDDYLDSYFNNSNVQQLSY